MLNNYFLQLSGLKFEKKYYKNRPSVTNGCKTKEAEVQIPSSSTNNELTLSAYNSLSCYKLSDDGVSRVTMNLVFSQCPLKLSTLDIEVRD